MTILLLLMNHSSVYPRVAFDSSCSDTKSSYLFAHGLFAGEVQMAKYCPQFVASTGELVTCEQGGCVIGHRCSAVTFAEIDKRAADACSWSANIVRCCGTPFLQYIACKKYGIRVAEQSASCSVTKPWINLEHVNLGQDEDIELLSTAYERHQQTHPTTDVVLYGVSRGAVAVFNFLATHKPEGVKAAVLEGVFDDIAHLIQHFGWSSKGDLIEALLHAALGMYAGAYKPQGIFPSTVVTQSADIPLLIVTSLGDWEVPFQCNIRLYVLLQKHGFKKVHLLILQNPGHSDYIVGDTDDKHCYEAVVHAFYKHYGLEYCEELAQEGAGIFSMTQPELRVLQERYFKPAEPCITCREIVLA